MKKLITILISLLLMFNLTVCGKNDSIPEPEQPELPAEMPSGDQTENNINDADVESAGGKALIVYYSASGNTKEVANYIAAATGGDFFEIVPAEAYSDADLNWRDENSRVSKEHDNEGERNKDGF